MTDQTQTTTEPVLLPCPFCGGEAWLNDYEAKHSDLPPQSRAPQCRSCGVSPGYLPTAKKAIAAWNTRTTPQPLAIGLDRSRIDRIRARLQKRSPGDEAYEKPMSWDDADYLVSILALAAPAEVNGHVASALLWFGSQHNLELSYGYEVDGEGGDGWQVHSVNGGRNDREWTRLSFGHDTPIKAIAACLPAAPTGEGK